MRAASRGLLCNDNWSEQRGVPICCCWVLWKAGRPAGGRGMAWRGMGMGRRTREGGGHALAGPGLAWGPVPPRFQVALLAGRAGCTGCAGLPSLSIVGWP